MLPYDAEREIPNEFSFAFLSPTTIFYSYLETGVCGRFKFLTFLRR